jgi:hypothetical protein
MGKDIIDEVQKRQLIRFGHMNRMDETRWPRKVLQWVPQQKHKRGRPGGGWRGYIKEAVETRDLVEEDFIEGKSVDGRRRNGVSYDICMMAGKGDTH